MSRVVRAVAYGGPEVLELVDEEVASPGPGEALVEIRAAGINPADWKIYGGLFGGTDASRLPLAVGMEGAGVVVALGDEDASGPAGPLAVGDEVIAFRASGTYAERVVLPTSALVPKPAEMSFAQAGGLMLAGATAVHGLTATRVGEGDVVLLHGGAGGVGHLAIQLARLRGARVIATASERNHDLLRRLGAEPTTYGDGLADRVRALAPEGVDAAYDAVGTDEAVDVSLELVADRGRIVSIAAFHRQDDGIVLIGSGPGADPGTELRDAARLELVGHVAAGRLEVVAEGEPLADVADVHRRLQGGHVAGKVVLVP